MLAWSLDETYSAEAIIQHGDALYQSLLAENEGHLPSEEGSTWWALYRDPIIQVHDALWALLEAHAPLASMVKVKNRVKLSGSNRDPLKAEISDADLPELRITPSSSKPHLQRTSNGSSLVKRFRVEVATGDQRVDAGLFALEWEIYRALSAWVQTLIVLTWNEKTYVRLARPITVQDGKSDVDLIRGIRGWSALWECEVEMWFTTLDLKET